jgi:hypothetical protein
MIRNNLADSIALTGSWEFSLGSESPQGTIQVPGCWEAQGYSKFLEGPGHYQRKVHIPEEWAGCEIYCEFEAVSYACELLLNGVQLGEHRGLWTPFLVDLTHSTRPGENNTLELMVYKPGDRFPIRSTLAGFLPDVATTFGGIWQPAYLRAFKVGIDDFKIDVDYDQGGLRISCQAETFDKPLIDGYWEILVFSGGNPVTRRALPLSSDGKLGTYLNIEDPILWSPTNPHLYTVQVTLVERDKPVAQVSKRIGFRRMTTQGDQLLFNDQPIMVRGILSWGWEPDRIAPVYNPEQAREEMRRVRQLGFNLIKLCLFVPNQAYYDVADEEGMLLWQEWPMWLPEITPELRETIKDEYSAMMGLTRQHPSIVLYSLGCELSQAVDGELLEDLNDVVRDLVSDVLVCDNSGSGESYGGLDYDFSDFTDYHPYCDIHYFEALLENWRRDWQSPRPWIFGEFCDSDTFRDINEIIDKNGGQRPWWLTSDNPVTTWRPESLALIEGEDRLERAKPGFTSQELVRISHAQSLVERKYTLESLRRRRGMGGYVITGLRDTPISTSGIWDDLYRPKWDSTEFLKINGDAVLTLDITRKRRWHNGGDRPDRLDVYNHLSGSTVRWAVILNFTGKKLIEGGKLSWSLVDKHDTEIQFGNHEVTRVITPGVPQDLGTINCDLPVVEKGTEFRLQLSLQFDGTAITNQWPVWVFPSPPIPPGTLGIFDPAYILDDYSEWLDGIARVTRAEDLPAYGMLLTTVLDGELFRYVDNGGKLLLLQHGDGPLPSRRCPFWRESIILFPEHPLWQSFPQYGYADMQFFGVASDIAFDSRRLLTAIPDLKDLRPILRRLDAREFHMSEYLFEAKVGKGMLSACSLCLQGGAGVQPYGWRRNIAGSALLWMMLDYMVNV